MKLLDNLKAYIRKIWNPQRTKQCSKCSEVKPITEFYHDTHQKDGYRTICKRCEREYKKTQKSVKSGDSKRCSKCGLIKTVDNFNHDWSKPDGYRTICRACDLAHRRAYYKEKTKIQEPSQVSVTKLCPKCGIIKPNSEFHKNKANKDGLASYCKSCFSENYSTAKRKKHQEEKEEKKKRIAAEIALVEQEYKEHALATQLNKTAQEDYRIKQEVLR